MTYKLLLCRPREKVKRLLQELEREGILFDLLPPYEFVPLSLSLQEKTHLFEKIQQSDWLLFGSPLGVQFFFSLLPFSLPFPPLVCIGESTAKALTHKGFPPLKQFQTLQEAVKTLPGKILRITSQEGLTHFSSLSFESVPLYTSRPLFLSPEEKKRIQSQFYQGVLIGSPSCYDRAAQQLGHSFFENKTLLVRGETTYQYLKSKGLKATIVSPWTGENIVYALERRITLPQRKKTCPLLLYAP